MSAIGKKTYSTKQVVWMVITVFLMFVFGHIVPPFATLTPLGMRLLGIFLGLVIGYTVWDVIPVSLLGFVAFGTCGYTSFNSAVASMMGSSTVYQTMVLFFTSGAIVYYGFGQWFARWSLSLKVFQGKPMLYTWFFFYFCTWAGFLVGQTSMILLLCPIWDSIAEACGYSNDKDNFRYYGFGGIVLGLVSGGGMMTYKGWLLGIADQWAALVGEPINLAFQFGVNVILTGVLITFYCFVGKIIFKVDLSQVKAFDTNKMSEESKYLRPRVKRILVVYFITVFLAIACSAPGISSIAIFKWINSKVTLAGCYTLCSALLIILPSGEKDGETCIPFSKISKALVNWPVIFMCAVIIPVASALVAEPTGVLPWLNSIFAPMFSGKGGAVLVVFTCAVQQLLTNVGSNIAFGSAMVPIVGPFAVEAGLNLTIMGTAIMYCTNIGLVLPGASAPAALFHSRPEIPDGGRRIKVMLFAALSVVICCCVVYGPIAIMMG